MNRNELYHHGVKGMHWGIRKEKRRQNKLIKSNIKGIKEQQRKRAANTDINKLSNQELRDLNDRIRNENAYIESLRKQDKSIKAVSDIID